MYLTRSLQLGASLLFTLLAVNTLVVYGSSRLAFDSETHLQATLRKLQTQSGGLWHEMVSLVREITPPPAMAVPQGDPDRALRELLTYPAVTRAFYISPNHVLHVREYRWSQGKRHQEAYRIDLAEWRPQTLNLGFEKLRRDHQGDPAWWNRSGRAYMALNEREEFIQLLVMDHPWGSRHAFLPGYSRGLSRHNLYVKGEAQNGYLGYALDPAAIENHGKELLVREGLDEVLEWQMDSWLRLASDHEIAPPFVLSEDLAFLRLRFVGDSFSPQVVQQVWRSWLNILFLIVLTVLGISAAMRQARALIHDRELALAQSNFVSAVSHEMRTPLTTIKMYADMLDQGIVTEPEKRSRYFQTIGQECDRLTRLVENVLDYAQISGKRRAYHFEPLNTQDLVEEALATMRASLAAAGMDVEVAVPSLSLEGDRDALVQALLNLLSNALKYARDGGRVRVFAEEGDASVTLGVTDWGPGIPPKERGKVFQAFYRVGSELTRTAPGSGLGLSLVEAYAKAHGGSVKLTSVPGQGSTFRIVLPQTRRTA